MSRLPVPLIACLLAAGLLAGACSSSEPELLIGPSVEAARAQHLADLRHDVATLADTQEAADAELLQALDLIRAVDEEVAAVRVQATMDDTLDAHHVVNARFLSTSVVGLRSGFMDVATRVDDSRETLAEARRSLDDPWELSYLDAQETVLTAVRDYAQTADQLAQLIVRHWDVYSRVNDALTSFAERRWFFRTEQEAADALVVEYETLFAELRVPQAQIAEWRADREAAAAVVNEATADAVDVWESRPSEQPTTTSS